MLRALTKNRLILRPYNFRFSFDNDIFYSVMNNDERNGCVLTQWKVLRSFEAFSFTYEVTIGCCYFWCKTCSL